MEGSVTAEPRLSFRARRLVGALKREVGGQAPAEVWLGALARANGALVEAVSGRARADAVLVAAGRGLAGPGY